MAQRRMAPLVDRDRRPGASTP